MKKEELKNYEPKGQLEGLPKEIISRMLDYQEEQGNPRNVRVFERNEYISEEQGGFDWDETKEKGIFWEEVIINKNFNLFFEKYPKQNSQEFKVGDKVIDIIRGQKGKIHEIMNKDNNTFPIHINFNEGAEAYTLDGKYFINDKHPRLLHYRDDYDYNVIDFNNLPKRQEPKRWRAERNRGYYFVFFNSKDWFFSDESNDDYYPIDDANYNSGNYFSTEVEAEIIAQKLNTYMRQLIEEEHGHKRN